jgi:Kae1-associated kinase Bud32
MKKNSGSSNQIIAQGAEAILIKQKSNLIKNRIKKSYRLEIIDNKLRKSRTKHEAKLLEKSLKLIPVPKITKPNKDKNKITMHFIKGKKLSDWLDRLKNKEKICSQIGKNIAALHNHNIIHGDLTTSNMIFQTKTNKVYFIDFGLGFVSSRIEDKTVDLHLLRQALEAKHFKNWQALFQAVLKAYKSYKDSNKVLQHLKKVESRGRYKRH